MSRTPMTDKVIKAFGEEWKNRLLNTLAEAEADEDYEFADADQAEAVKAFLEENKQ